MKYIVQNNRNLFKKILPYLLPYVGFLPKAAKFLVA